MRAHRFRVYETGGPEALRWEEFELEPPSVGEVLVRYKAVGFNMVDVYLRKGAFRRTDPPFEIGVEAAGVVEQVGDGVTGVQPGDRIAYIGGGAYGTYAEAAVIPDKALVKVPDWMDDQTAASVISKGCTVEYLFSRTHKLMKGDTILFHAAAGGVGSIACQWARHVGATLIGTVGSDEKAKKAKAFGATHVINYSRQDFAEEVMKLTDGEGVDVVYDSVGKDTWQGSLDSVKRLGLVVSFGNASGPPPPFDLVRDGQAKSIFVTRTSTVNYMTTTEVKRQSAEIVFEKIRSGAVKFEIGQTYALEDAAQAHRDVESRLTSGATVLFTR